MSEESLKIEDSGEAAMQIGQKRQNTENGGPASKKANITESGLFLIEFNLNHRILYKDTVQIKVLIPSAAVGALIG